MYMLVLCVVWAVWCYARACQLLSISHMLGFLSQESVFQVGYASTGCLKWDRVSRAHWLGTCTHVTLVTAVRRKVLTPPTCSP